MKKSDALKNVPEEYQNMIRPLERLNLYYLSRSPSWRVSTFGPGSNPNNEKIPALLTHFYKYGIKFKVLIHPNALSRNGYYHVRYSILSRYTITPMPAEDLPLFAGQAHPNMSDAFKRAKPFNKTK